jgi:beta-phosphoglucomutase-like phosphatase (HAD superfamily)
VTRARSNAAELAMGFNRRKMEDQRREAAEKEAANRRATDAQVLEDAERLIGAWNERQGKRMPMLFSPTIGAAITAGYWFLWVHCPARRTINALDLRGLDRHPGAAVTSLIPALSCRSCRPNAPFAELVRLSRTSIADETREEHRHRVLGE